LVKKDGHFLTDKECEKLADYHAQIYKNNDSFFLQDLGSKEGTFVAITDTLLLQE